MAVLSDWIPRNFGLIPAAILVLLWSTAGGAQEQSGTDADHFPIEMIRSLQALQEQIAKGNTHAMQAQRKLLAKMDRTFVELPVETWQDPRNARAAVVHLLSGGHPKVMKHLLSLEPLPSVDKKLMEASLAYVEGREDEMQELLADIDPLELPASLGGHVALVKAAPFIRKDPVKAMELLQVASLLMPGTLVEEAALRREVFVAGMMADVERFRVLSIRYLRRFRSSVYAGDFRRRFAVALDTLGFVQSEDKFRLLDDVLREFDADSRRGLYLRLARSALLAGHMQVARKSTDEALVLAVAGTKERELLKIYLAATRLDADAMTENRNLLWSIDKNMLSQDDLDLLQGVYTVLNSVRHFPEPPENVIGEFNVASNMDAPAERPWLTPDMEIAEKLLRRTEKSLTQLGEPK
ncbi:MAG: chemotaxis protein [Roseibium sp.]|uniref:chemotaxis protein n=1 Tax=Roseibium sp. TaxID=1936156 RepID=UPI002618E6F2|nr:chemotaxis protein [Roseibium sp.]MCV0428329.1 chemotaxis protein [Roseibium sp.]